MPDSAAESTLAELERILEVKKRRLAGLHRKRDRIERRLETVTGKIARIEGTDRRPGRPRSPGTSTNGTAPAGHTAPAKRFKNDRTLREVVADVLSQNKKGLGLDELSKQVLATGYQTTSTNFKNTLYQTLYHHDEFQLDKEAGLYTVGKAAK